MRIFRLAAVMGCIAASVACFADPPRPARVDFSSKPEGADVMIDGVPRGVTPLTVFDLSTGERHHVRISMKNHEPADDFFMVEPGTYLPRHYELAPEKGLLLVTSEPSGATVTLDGYSLGETPRLVTSLDVGGTYRLELKKTGYQSVNVDVKFNGRSPLVKHEKLLLDSGILIVKSSPSGADVVVNGVSHGQTPVTVKDVPKGRATVLVSLEGYISETREIVLNAGDERSLDVELEGLPGRLLVSSVPDGARIYINGTFAGKAPFSRERMKPGKYDLRVELDGHTTASRTVEILHGASASEEFRLVNNRGRMEVRTTPAGVQVVVDGRIVGATKESRTNFGKSEWLAIENMDEGEHTVILRKEGFSEIVKHPIVEKGKTVQVKGVLKRVFTPDIEVVTSSGTYRGVLISNTPEGVEVETSMGVTSRFLRNNIREINIIGK